MRCAEAADVHSPCESRLCQKSIMLGLSLTSQTTAHAVTSVHACMVHLCSIRLGMWCPASCAPFNTPGLLLTATGMCPCHSQSQACCLLAFSQFLCL